MVSMEEFVRGRERARIALVKKVAELHGRSIAPEVNTFRQYCQARGIKGRKAKKALRKAIRVNANAKIALAKQQEAPSAR
jgi:hypothetical protein